MSVLQVANLHFEATGNNRIQYTGSNGFVFVTAGSNNMIVNSSIIQYSANLSITGSSTTISTGNMTVNSTGVYYSGPVSYSGATAFTSPNLTVNSIGAYFSGVTNFSGTVNHATANVLSQTLTDAATINWDVSQGAVAYLTLGATRTMAAPTNLKVGTYILHVVQGGSGSYVISWNPIFKWTAGVAPTLSTAVGRRDIFSFICDGTYLYGAMIPDVR